MSLLYVPTRPLFTVADFRLLFLDRGAVRTQKGIKMVTVLTTQARMEAKPVPKALKRPRVMTRWGAELETQQDHERLQNSRFQKGLER